MLEHKWVSETAQLCPTLCNPIDCSLPGSSVHGIFQARVLLEVKWSEVAQLCLTLCDPIDCSLPGLSIHGIFQARVLEWVAISFSRGSSQPRDWTQVSHIAGRRFKLWATREALKDLHVRAKTHRRTSRFWIWQWFLGYDTQNINSKMKIQKLDLIKIKTFVYQRTLFTDLGT